MRTLRVADPGMFTTVQDLGRAGHAASGVPPSGAADPLSLTIGNRLLANPDNAAALECTLTGPSLTLETDAWVCLTGSVCPEARVTGAAGVRALPWCEPTHVRAGEQITIGALRDGARAYVCFSGGLGSPPVLGSRSTLVGLPAGERDGRALRSNDELPLIDDGCHPRARPGELHDWLRTHLLRRTLRIVHSLDTDRFPPGAVRQLASASFTVGEQSNRTGIRLRGPAIPLPEDAALFESEPTVTGGVQISADAQPIILGPDRPTTGGYPLLACVIRTDQTALAMLRPRDTLRFEIVSLEAARQLATEQRRTLDTLLPPNENATAP